jgi:LPXTG-motif cell wall-anchored protein
MCWDCGKSGIAHIYSNGTCITCGLAEDAPSTYTVYYDNSTTDWSNVYIYAWNTTCNNTVEYTGTWPGSAMTLGADGWYTAEVPAWAANIIINNNNNGAQTQDMAIEMGRDLWIVVEASEGGFTGTVSYESAKTGDSTSLVGLAAAMLLSAAGLVVLTYKKKEI